MTGLGTGLLHPRTPSRRTRERPRLPAIDPAHTLQCSPLAFPIIRRDPLPPECRPARSRKPRSRVAHDEAALLRPAKPHPHRGVSVLVAPLGEAAGKPERTDPCPGGVLVPHMAQAAPADMRGAAPRRSRPGRGPRRELGLDGSGRCRPGESAPVRALWDWARGSTNQEPRLAKEPPRRPGAP